MIAELDEPAESKAWLIRTSICHMKADFKLDPTLKTWLDSVIIPTLLQEYVQSVQIHVQKPLASNAKPGVVSVSEVLDRKEAS